MTVLVVMHSFLPVYSNYSCIVSSIVLQGQSFSYWLNDNQERIPDDNSVVKRMQAVWFVNPTISHVSMCMRTQQGRQINGPKHSKKQCLGTTSCGEHCGDKRRSMSLGFQKVNFKTMLLAFYSFLKIKIVFFPQGTWYMLAFILFSFFHFQNSSILMNKKRVSIC